MWRNNNTKATSPYTSISGLDSGGLYSNINDDLPVHGGAFTPFQWREHPQQSGIHVAPTLPVPFTQSSVTFGHPVFPYSPARSRLGHGHFHLSSTVNVCPDRCHRTDGKKWRCRNDAVPTSKYCPRHMFRGRKRRNYAVSNTTIAASLMPGVDPLSSVVLVHGDHSSNILIAHRQMKSVHTTITTSLPTQLNRMPVTENYPNGHVWCSPDLSMSSPGPNCLRPISLIRDQPYPNAATSSLPDFGVTSTESHLSMPTSPIVENSSLNSTEVHDPERDSIEELCQSLFDYSTNTSQVSLPMASFPTPENATLTPFANELNSEQWPWLDSVGGVLRESFANNSGVTTGNKNLSSADIETEEWDLSPEFA